MTDKSDDCGFKYLQGCTLLEKKCPCKHYSSIKDEPKMNKQKIIYCSKCPMCVPYGPTDQKIAEAVRRRAPKACGRCKHLGLHVESDDFCSFPIKRLNKEE